MTDTTLRVRRRLTADRDLIAAAYRTMAARARYRPGAPSDGSGNLAPGTPRTVTDAEITTYARQFLSEEDERSFFIGCATSPDYLPALILAVEAARLCCAGFGQDHRIKALLRAATEALPAEGDDR